LIKRAVIFDMDGVIVDSENFWTQAEYEVFSSLGAEINDDLTAQTRSMTTCEVTQFWYRKKPWENVTFKEVEQLVIDRVIELIQEQQCEINGIKSFIVKLKQKGYKIGLATNSPEKIIPYALEKSGIRTLFDVVSSAEFEKAGKPDPAVYLSAAKKLNIKPELCFAIEDSQSGILAAKKAGMTAIAFTNGNPNLVLTGADFTLTDFGSVSLDTIL
jgi:HAD superfamily hydrolase (TIGR01509 family)